MDYTWLYKIYLACSIKISGAVIPVYRFKNYEKTIIDYRIGYIVFWLQEK